MAPKYSYSLKLKVVLKYLDGLLGVSLLVRKSHFFIIDFEYIESIGAYTSFKVSFLTPMSSNLISKKLSLKSNFC